MNLAKKLLLRSLYPVSHRLFTSTINMTCIGTHDGRFHTDEVLACYMLRCLPEYKQSPVVRSRDPEVLKTCKIVVDVGGIYDSTVLRFDHHQKEFNETMKSLKTLDFDTRLSSAGLIYNHFGRRVIATILELDSTESPVVDLLFKKMYENFVHAVDAIDNGVAQYDGPPKYKLPSTLDSRVSSLNPAWNSNVAPDLQFQKAMDVVGEEFANKLKFYYNAWLPAREYVQKSIDNRKNYHPSGKILMLENGSCPWKIHFLEIEKEKGLEKEDITYMIVQNSLSDWRIIPAPIDEFKDFQNRCPFPMEWCGLRDEKLSEVSEIPGCIFVHVNGFIGGNKTFNGALQMAEKSLIIAGKWTRSEI